MLIQSALAVSEPVGGLIRGYVVARILIAALSGAPLNALPGAVLAASPTPSPSLAATLTPSPTPGPSLTATPTPSPSTVSSDFVSALPTWLLIVLIALVALIVAGMFALTAYTLSAPRSTLKNLLGRRGRSAPPEKVSASLIADLARSARIGRRTTRTTLAIAGFSLLGVVVIAVFGLSGQGVRDLRNQVIASITTLVAAIAGFYFGAQTAAQGGEAETQPASTTANSPPGLEPGTGQPAFTVGNPGSYTPILTGTPGPTVTVSPQLPLDLKLDATTGTISGTPAAGTDGTYQITLTASNGTSPDATVPVTLTISP
jgi:hypothetical protein